MLLYNAHHGFTHHMLYYTVTLEAMVGMFGGFFIQARIGDSIVGTWAPQNGQAQAVRCDGNLVNS